MGDQAEVIRERAHGALDGARDQGQRSWDVAVEQAGRHRRQLDELRQALRRGAVQGEGVPRDGPARRGRERLRVGAVGAEREPVDRLGREDHRPAGSERVDGRTEGPRVGRPVLGER